MSRYREIADDLRERIQAGEWSVGSQLPGITTLQDHYGVRGLNTIRAAQQVLVAEGMLETRQGAGAFVTSATSLRQVNVVDTITEARDALTTALTALTAQRRVLVIDFDAEDDETHFVLTSALGDWAVQKRFELQDETHEPTRQQWLRWAKVAEALMTRANDT
ncbi:GntR family transcriptional regulator [Prauserella endophytica]|nr:GntR family transcriptional regulator [Prauserella endophytica]